jgi:transposase, IS5 family
LLTNGHLEKPASHEIIAPSTFQFLKLMIKESLFAAEERETKLDKLGDVLQVLEKHVDFAALAAAIDKAAPRASRDRGGRPPFPTEIMVRTLLLQQLYNLSDERLEFQLLDRLSFQRFVGLRHSSQISDRTTFWTFRERLLAAGASETIFEAANRELDKHGYLARGGQIIDASIVPAPKQRLPKEQKALIKDQAMPIDWSPAKRRQKDIDATRAKKHGKSYFGYKLSANADKRYKLIRKIKVSTASECETRLKATSLRVYIQRKAAKGKPLSDCQKGRNTRIAKTRARVEHVFASLEQMGGKGLRCIGLDRATLRLNFKAAAYNLRRLCRLKTCGIKSAFAF